MSDTRTWRHSRKGLITGRVVREDDTWMHIELAGDHRLRWLSEANRGRANGDGTFLTARKSLLTEIDNTEEEGQ